MIAAPVQTLQKSAKNCTAPQKAIRGLDGRCNMAVSCGMVSGRLGGGMAEEKASGWGWVIAVWVAAAVVLGVVLVLPKPPHREPTAVEKAADKFEMALMRCRGATKEWMADPDGLRFAPFSEWLVLPDDVGDGMTLTYGVVGRNSYGGLVPATLRCHATYDGKYWTVTDLKQQ